MTQETKYETLRRALAELIEARMAPHDSLPSERELMQQYGVSRMTVRQAIDGLVRDGRVYRVQGAGTFVADSGKITKSLTFSSFSEDIRARRMKPGGRLLLLESEPAEIDVARDLFLEPGTPVVHITRLRTADGEPMCLENAWVPEHLVPDLAARGHVESLYDVLEAAGAAPEHADQTISATVVNRGQAELLGVPNSFPALRVSRVTHDARGRAVERAISLYRADRYDYRLSIARSRKK
ncbi:GntR family transcriptional regulator [Nonomuraea mesophila]|uniref:GntR family transcriptional regulator n=1 Tax=Nonomuraea mesophila TaxID=2530382 RepID=A0A4V6PG90_9ACTN|nr:GntR family transcriptional regulator [Nonomuraea mesophila]TDE39306.1 GntR family transcriptional regulator [Nonomuraea mesophila]